MGARLSRGSPSQALRPLTESVRALVTSMARCMSEMPIRHDSSRLRSGQRAWTYACLLVKSYHHVGKLNGLNAEEVGCTLRESQ